MARALGLSLLGAFGLPRLDRVREGLGGMRGSGWECSRKFGSGTQSPDAPGGEPNRSWTRLVSYGRSQSICPPISAASKSLSVNETSETLAFMSLGIGARFDFSPRGLHLCVWVHSGLQASGSKPNRTRNLLCEPSPNCGQITKIRCSVGMVCSASEELA